MSYFFSLITTAFSYWNKDKAPRLGAALSYYTIFSLAPLLVIILSVTSFFFGKEAMEGEVFRELRGFLGNDSALLLQNMIKNTHTSSLGWWPTVIGTITLLLGASGVFGQLKDALNTIWGVEPKGDRGTWGLARERFLSFSMVVVIGFLLTVSLLLSSVIALISTYFSSYLPFSGFLLEGVNFIVSLFVLCLLFALINKVLPDVEVKWSIAFSAAVPTAILFSFGKTLLGVYIGQGSTSSAYGAAGSLIVILLWIYYSSQILFFGTEFAKAYAVKKKMLIKPSHYGQLAPIVNPVVSDKSMTKTKKEDVVQQTLVDFMRGFIYKTVSLLKA